MFKNIEKEYKYYFYECENHYFKVPTFKRETKVIDFARGIIKILNHILAMYLKKMVMQGVNYLII